MYSQYNSKNARLPLSCAVRRDDEIVCLSRPKVPPPAAVAADDALLESDVASGELCAAASSGATI